MAVALVGAGLGALVGFGADLGGQLGLDQGLEHQLHAAANDVDVAASVQCVEQLGQVRLIEGHRCFSFVIPARNTSKITPMAHQVVDPYGDLHHVTGRMLFRLAPAADGAPASSASSESGEWRTASWSSTGPAATTWAFSTSWELGRDTAVVSC